ncbi:hypothetical protein Tco_1239573 [Tanacetum coccineum]
MVPSGDEAPIEDQPLTANASPTTLSPGYVADSDSEEDPKEDHANYPANGGDGDDEPSDDGDDDDDADDEDEEPSEDKDDDEEEEEHLALADSFVVPVVDLVPLAGDTEAFETDESAPTPKSPQTIIPPSQTRLYKAQKMVRPLTPILFPPEVEVDRLLALPTLLPSPLSPRSSLLPQIPSLPLLVSSLPLPLPSPLTTSLTDARAPLGYMTAGIKMRALLPSISHRTNIPEAEMLPQKRACFTTPAPGFEVGESSAAVLRDNQGLLWRPTLGETGLGRWVMGL